MKARRGLSSLILALVGLGLAIYLTIEHYTASATLACPESAVLNCQKVTTSKWSHLGPVPVALLGLAYFVVMALLCTPSAWRRHALLNLRVALAGAGVAAAIVLVWIELFEVDAVCLYCTAVHVCSLGLLASVLWTTSTIRGDWSAADNHPKALT